MPPETPMYRPAALVRGLAAVAFALAALAALAACQTSRNLMNRLEPHAQTVVHKPASSDPLTGDLDLLQRWLDAPTAMRASLLASAEKTYQASPGDRQKLRLALLLGEPGKAAPGVMNLPRAQFLLQGLLSDPETALSPQEQTLARLELVMITRQLTLRAENRTLRTTAAQRMANLSRKLHSSKQQNVTLQRQLGEAQAKLAAIANIEKSLGGKLGNEASPK